MKPLDATAAIRVLIVDDHPMMREGVATVLRSQPDVCVVGEADNGRTAVEVFAALAPDITLMDLQMPGMDGVESITEIRRIRPDARIIVLTTYAGDAKALSALKAGAAGYLLKNSIRKELVDAIHAVHAGRPHLPPDVATRIAVHAVDNPLSEREISILKLIAEGLGNKQVAWRLSISEDTVKTHLRSTYAKLHVADRTHAVTTAARRGIIDL